MKPFPRSLGLALLIGVSPIAVLVAQAARDGGWNMSAESRERLQDGRLAAAKATLKLTPEQEKLWAPIEEQVRTMYKERADKRAEREKRREERRAERDKAGDQKAGDQKSADNRQRPNVAERYERIAKRLSDRADKMKAFSSAFSPFYASLTDAQKEVVGPAMRQLRVAQLGRGDRGHGHHRGWHDGGWGKRWGGHDRGGGNAPEQTDDGAKGDEAPGRNNRAKSSNAPPIMSAVSRTGQPVRLIHFTDPRPECTRRGRMLCNARHPGHDVAARSRGTESAPCAGETAPAPSAGTA